MFESLAQKLWGNFVSKDERKKFVRLALIFAFTIGVYWLLVPLKDVVFLTLVGKEFLPWTKIFSLVVLIPLLMVYERLVDRFPRHRLFYVLCGVYGLAACIFAYLLWLPEIGLSNTNPSGWRALGWIFYAFVESFGSLMVALFWSFASDTSTPDSAKRGYSIIAFGAQVGGVTGPLVLYPLSSYINPVAIILLAVCGMAILASLIVRFMHVTPESELVGYTTDQKTAAYRKPAPRFFDGFKLIASQPYLLGVLVIVTFYEVVSTVIEFHMKTFAAETFADVAHRTHFFFMYAVFANGIALLSLLFGVGAVGRALGLTKTLLLLPSLIGCGIIVLWLKPTLWVALGVLVLIKGLNYALNQPTKEQLYIPTSRDYKYKAKAWIDTFGSRAAKSAGSSVHMLHPVLQSTFVMVSSLVSLGLIGVWIGAALFVAHMHDQALKEDRLVC